MFKQKLKLQTKLNKRALSKRSDITSKQIDTSSTWWIVTRLLLKVFILVFFGAIILFPFYYMISVSLMSEDNFTKPDNVSLAPKKFHWGNFVSAFEDGYWKAVLYSFIVTTISIILKLVVTLLMGYAFSLKKWWGKRVFWYFFLALMFLPEVALLSGQYQVTVKLGWDEGMNVIIGLFIPFIASIFSAYLFRNAFEAIPEMTKKAAMIDNVTGSKYFIKVAIPLITPTIWTAVILTAFAAWNSYMWPALLLQGEDIQTIPTWVFTTGEVQRGLQTELAYTIRMAGTVLAIVPMFVGFLLMRGRIMKSISKQGSAIKG